ncbi:MAG: response regulator, partial [Azonexus sp.]|nr:response regulator [Azonexus sp.]
RLALEFKVQDTGIGMSAEQIARLFTPFSQADSSTTRRFGGTGLGLVICQRLIALMGGKIWVDSEPGIGSTFSFDVWLDAVSADHSEAKARGRVLVVDDHELSRTVLSAVLKNQGYDVIAADSGEAALALLLNAPQAPVDYVLTDFLMPGMDGLALARHLRDALRYPLKIVLVTTLDTASAADPAVLASFDAILEKPVTAQKVGETLSRLKRGAVLPAIAAPAAQTSLAGMSILVAEDVPTNQLIIRDLLESLGATVYIADHGEAAVQGVQALAKQLDLVLMDIQMPVMDGLAATRQIRAGGVRADIPIIALTANVFSEERERAMAAGMTDFLVKPIEPERLVDVLQRWRPTRPPTEASEPAPVPLAVNAAPADFPALAGIDTVDGLRRMMNRRGLYEKVLQDFYLRFDGETGRIIDALQSGEREMAIRRAHSLKGTGGTIGAQRLAECARQLEASLREATQDAPPQAALDALGMALDEVLASIAAAFPGMRPSSS